MKKLARTLIGAGLILRGKGRAAIVLGIGLVIAFAGQQAAIANPDPLDVGDSENSILEGEWDFDLNPVHETSRNFGATPALDELGPTVNDSGEEADSDIEIIMGSDGIGVHGNPYDFFPGVWRVIDSTGAVERFKDTQCDQARGNIAVADLDGGGTNEYIGSTTSGHCIEVMDKDLNFIWTFPEPPTPGNTEFHSSPSVGDTDPEVAGLEIANLHRPTCDVLLWDGTPQDGVDEGVTGFTTLPGTGYSWSGTDGIDWDVLWTQDLPGYDCFSTTTMADVDNDGDTEVIAGVVGEPHGTGDVYVLDGSTGAIEATFDTNGIQASVSVADLDGDSFLEMSVGDQGGTFHVFEWDGGAASTECSVALDGGIRSSAAIGDIDGDDPLEMVVGTDGGKVHALSPTCAVEWTFDTGSSDPVVASPVLADRTSVSTYQVEWPMFQHDRQRTGYYGPSNNALDVYVGAENDYAYVVDGNNGSKIDRFRASGPIHGSASVGDIDGDGCLEVTFQSWGEFSGGYTRIDRVWNVQDTGTPGATCSEPPEPPEPPLDQTDVEILGWDVPQYLSLDVSTPHFFSTVKTIRNNGPIGPVDLNVHKSMNVPEGMEGSLHVTQTGGEHIFVPPGVSFRVIDPSGSETIGDPAVGLDADLPTSTVVIVEGLPEPSDPFDPRPHELEASFQLQNFGAEEVRDVSEEFDLHCLEFGFYNVNLSNNIEPIDAITGFNIPDYKPWNNHASSSIGVDCAPGAQVEVDIKPGSFPNSINLESKGVIPVAILTTEFFDATQVDAGTVRFGPAGAEYAHRRAHVEDVDGDGDLDLVLHFPTQDTGIAPEDTQACLTGQTLFGMPIQGCDSVRTVPPSLDTDGDGFGDAVEATVGTDHFRACGPGAWPPDWDDSQTVDLLDVLSFKPHYGAPDPSDPRYDARYDLNMDGAINLLDLLPFKQVFRLSCTP